MAKSREESVDPFAELGLSPDLQKVLDRIQAELSISYRESFVAMIDSLKRQASALERIQNTLNILIRHMAPQLEGQLPAAVRVAGDAGPDIASAIVVADPIATGYTLSQASLAKALAISSADVSALLKAFKLSEDGRFAVTVRKGKRNNIVNYHVRAIERFHALVVRPPSGLNRAEARVLERVRGKIQKPA